MERSKRKLTTCEEIAIFYHVFADEKNWNLLYESAIGTDRFNKLKDNSKQKAVSNWKHSPRVTERVKQLIYEKQRREEELKTKIIEEVRGRETETTNGKKIENITIKTDFLNRDEFLKFLNLRANQITDDKLRNDILKMLSDNMRYKENESEGESEIQRFYTPITCENCPIYNKCKGCDVAECSKEL